MMEEVRYPYHSPTAVVALDGIELLKWAVRRARPASLRRAHLPDVLKRRVLASYARRYGLNIFVESGTYLGATVAFMRKCCRQVYSIEFQAHLARAAQLRFVNDSAIRILEGDSSTLIGQVVATLQEPALFWLDGHFAPGTARHGEAACPTLQELSVVLKDERHKHVVLVDDARDFRGQGGYPTLDAFIQFVHAAKPNAHTEVRDDIIRITHDRVAGSSS